MSKRGEQVGEQQEKNGDKNLEKKQQTTFYKFRQEPGYGHLAPSC